jgi:hypothetical protein
MIAGVKQLIHNFLNIKLFFQEIKVSTFFCIFKNKWRTQQRNIMSKYRTTHAVQSLDRAIRLLYFIYEVQNIFAFHKL